MARKKTKMRTGKVKRVKKTRNSRRTKRNTRRRNKRGGDLKKFSEKMMQRGKNLMALPGRVYSRATDRWTKEKGYNRSSSEYFCGKVELELMKDRPDIDKIKGLLEKCIQYTTLYSGDTDTNFKHTNQKYRDNREAEFSDHIAKLEGAAEKLNDNPVEALADLKKILHV
jgi:hypothetical protein